MFSRSLVLLTTTGSLWLRHYSCYRHLLRKTCSSTAWMSQFTDTSSTKRSITDLPVIMASKDTLAMPNDTTADMSTVSTDTSAIPSDTTADMSTASTDTSAIPSDTTADMSTASKDTLAVPGDITADMSTASKDTLAVPGDTTADMSTASKDTLAVPGDTAQIEGNSEDTSVCSNVKPPGVVSRRMKRMRRRDQLHKQQLKEAAESDDNAESSTSKRRKTDESSKMENSHSEADVYIENGLRKVYPYYYTFLCYCKQRWKGTTLIDVLDNEFMAGTPEFHRSQINNGFVKVNGKDVNVNYVLRGTNELISNITHRHELPVTAQALKILSVTDEFVVVDKPSSIPVHPCGRFRHNSVVFMLSRDHGFHNLRTIYRLDRLTSGLLIFGRTHAATNRIMDSIKERNVTKTYLCRVEGQFPDGVVECKEPLDKVHQKIGTWRVKAGGKASHTSFEKVSYNGSSSVVKCYPRTGRTHQIRVHLQYLGHPIVNDPLYNDLVWGTEKGKNGEYGKSDTQLYEDLVAMHTSKFHECEPLEEEMSTTSAADADPRMIPDPNCFYCKKRYMDPHPDRLIMYLHALNYKGPDWQFGTEEPDWAQSDWKPAAQ